MARADFDFKNPDYVPIFRERVARLAYLRENPEQVPLLKNHYKHNIAQFIDDWGVTFDPRNIERGLPALVPFLLFDRQREWIDEFLGAWSDGVPFITMKSRDMGLSWLSIGVACSVCLFNDGVVAGFGSRKKEYVDRIGHPKALLYKARMFLRYIPPEFRCGFDERKHAPEMRITIPGTGSCITGECGDEIGRGDRTAFYFVDESAHLERPHIAEASLSATTNCRADISTPNGSDNPFAEKILAGKIRQFIFHWRDDPRKDEAWYDKQLDELDPVTVAQEIDLDFNASKEGIIIPSAWVQAAIDAHEKLGIEPTGAREGAFDVADQGRDKNAFAGRHGILLDHIESWSGSKDTSDIFDSVERCFLIADTHDYPLFHYDGDGLGAGVRGDARVINERREDAGQRIIEVVQFRGSGEIVDPDDEMVPGRSNKDFFTNWKEQSWWSLRLRFRDTFRAVNGAEYDPENIISLSSKLTELRRLCTELSQPTYTLRNGKILVDKQPEGSLSPNLADSAMMLYAPRARMSRGFFDI